jgi:hypothetical protein
MGKTFNPEEYNLVFCPGELNWEKGGYFDIYSAGLLFLIVLIVWLNIFDSLFTMMIPDLGTWDVNFIVRSAIELYRDKFWVWKFAIVSVPLILLCIHSKFRLAMTAILGVCTVKIAVLLYQFF